MENSNLFWPVYINLEKEVVQLADYLHFSDDQLGVYSSILKKSLIRAIILTNMCKEDA